ncbi:MAG: hypothetical protein WAN69_18480 [Candidatus Korobacteraceae bacterium]
MNIVGRKCAWSVIVTTTACLALSLSLSAQVETTTKTTAGNANVVTKVERGEVVTVSGNDLVVKMADGTLRNFENVPASAKVTVDGKQLGIHDLKPGMKLQRTITTTSTPMTITTVETVKGKVWAITPPVSIILTLEDGKNQQFKIPEDQKFEVDGQMVDAFAIRKGMNITATKITEQPAVEVTQSQTVTGQAAPPADVPILVAEGSEEAVPAPAAEPATAPAAAPEAASGLPTWVIWLVVLVVLAAIIWWYMSRKNRSA